MSEKNYAEIIKKTARYGRALGLPEFLLGVVFPASRGGKSGSEIIIHLENTTVKKALMVAIRSVHTVVDMEIGTPGISAGEVRVLQSFKEEMNALVRKTDKALIAAQAKKK